MSFINLEGLLCRDVCLVLLLILFIRMTGAVTTVVQLRREGECSMSDWGGSHEEYDANKVCATCTSYSGGWCDYHRCETNSSSYCSDYT